MVSPAAEFYRSVSIGLAVSLPWGIAVAFADRRPKRREFFSIISVLILLVFGWIFIGMGTTPFWLIISYAVTVLLFGEILCWSVNRFLGAPKTLQLVEL